MSSSSSRKDKSTVIELPSRSEKRGIVSPSPIAPGIGGPGRRNLVTNTSVPVHGVNVVPSSRFYEAGPGGPGKYTGRPVKGEFKAKDRWVRVHYVPVRKARRTDRPGTPGPPARSRSLDRRGA